MVDYTTRTRSAPSNQIINGLHFYLLHRRMQCDNQVSVSSIVRLWWFLMFFFSHFVFLRWRGSWTMAPRSDLSLQEKSPAKAQSIQGKASYISPIMVRVHRGVFLIARDRLASQHWTLDGLPLGTRHSAPDWTNAFPRGLLLPAFKPEPTWRLVWKLSSLISRK